MKLLGVIMTFNDEHCIQNAVKCLKNSGHSVYVFNHGSIDSTLDVLNHIPDITIINVSRSEIPNFTKQGEDNIHHYVTKFILNQRNTYDWVTWIDSDEILCSNPGSKESLYDIIERTYKSDKDILMAEIREYWPTHGDDLNEENYLKRLNRFHVLNAWYGGGIVRSWRINRTPLMTEATQRHTFHQGGGVSEDFLLLRHFPIVNNGQGYQKINVDRQVTGGAGHHYISQGLKNAKELRKDAGWGQEEEDRLWIKEYL